MLNTTVKKGIKVVLPLLLGGTLVWYSLQKIALSVLAEYFKNANELKEWVNHQFDNDAVLSLEYFEICNEITLKPMRNKQPNTVYRAFIAVHIRDVRLIDNIALN